MNKQKLISIATWIVTVITVIMWLPVLMMPVVLLVFYMSSYNNGSMGEADGPTAIYFSPTPTNSVTFGFVGGGIGDFIVLGILLFVTILLWYKKIKLGKNKDIE